MNTPLNKQISFPSLQIADMLIRKQGKVIKISDHLSCNPETRGAVIIRTLLMAAIDIPAQASSYQNKNGLGFLIDLKV